MWWAGHVARVGEKWNVFRAFVGTAHYGHIFVFNLLQTLCLCVCVRARARKCFFLSNLLPNNRKNIAFLTFHRIRPFVLPSSIEIKLSMKHWWNDTDKGKPNFWNISWFYLVSYESIMGWTVIEPGSESDRQDKGLQSLCLACSVTFKDSFRISITKETSKAALRGVNCFRNVMAHAQKPDFDFRRKGRVHLNWWEALVQSTTCSRGVHTSGSNAGYTMFRGSVKSTGYPLHSPVSPFTSPPLRHRVPSHFNWTIHIILVRS